MANYPDTYAKVVAPSNENSQEAMKTRIEVMEFIQRVWNLIRNKDEWIQGLKCSKEIIKGAIEEEVEELEQTWSYSPTRPTIYEGLALQQLTLGLGDSNVVFKLDLERELKPVLIAVVARKLSVSVSEQFVVSITTDELFPGKAQSIIPKPISPLKKPSTSDILLEDDSKDRQQKSKTTKKKYKKTMDQEKVGD
ncbi:unnamed protein product [Mytilus coruscus]|uniref:Uncharacterized protein n=1 Tax=Mytilus coruscus TaxID=42192 RepID=A0A6J8B7J1_MYTCO|nr:unnamed protein product [Mytilus coruscus]